MAQHSTKLGAVVCSLVRSCAIAGAIAPAMGLVLIFLAGGCAPGGFGNDAGPGHRSQTLALTPNQELSLGRQAYQEVLSKSRVVRGGPQVDRVRLVGRRIADAAAIEPLQREINLRIQGYVFEWEFNVLQSDQVNAFCLPGGKVAVFTGLLPVAESDDQLAVVLGHEIAHALAHHASERIARQQMIRQAADVAAGSMGGMDERRRRELIGLLSAGAQVGSMAYDRQQESEADHIGVFLMTFAGYEPDQAVVFWERMQQASAGRARPPEILSDHPSDAKRIAKLRMWAPQAKAGKKAYDAGHIAPASRR
ncbi:MAG TPA: M48 family metallopeptidase [Gemmataceae bacterium]|nr:M48 family metallopeptidase [Gemmataceae bacterium]